MRSAGVALLVCAVLTPACGRPPDESWLQFLGYSATGTVAKLSVLSGDLGDGVDLSADAEFENGSLNVGQKVGTGILVNRARVDYQMTGYAPPSVEYPLNLYLAPPAESKATTGILSAFPLAPVSLKQWLIDRGVSDPVVVLTAHVTYYGQTDEGARLQTEGGIKISMTNTTVPLPATAPTAYVQFVRNVSKSAAGTTGAFRVYRTGSFASSLTIAFTTSGTTTAGTDYTISAPVVIPALANYTDILVTPTPSPAGATGTVIINLVDTASYKAVAPSSATLNITS